MSLQNVGVLVCYQFLLRIVNCAMSKMDKLKTLELEYPGDEAWSVFVEAHKNHNNRAFSEYVESLELQTVLESILGDSEAVSGWTIKPNAALGGKSPEQVLNSKLHGKHIIRSLIMRLPS